MEAWPSWQETVTSVKRLDRGPLRKDSRFRWTTPAPATPTTTATTLVITSTVKDVQQGKCIRWSGPAIGEGLRIDEGVHVWNFIKVKGGVLVRTEESWTGDQIEADPETGSQPDAITVVTEIAGIDQRRMCRTVARCRGCPGPAR
ncbi:hypothetical protein GCM10022419_062610 [Nonomuraea rosea]|uniref:Uncharacterized protein n=1 Tax=Nonomuraea rosea TaxID=638574 RepID=A0ABP6XW40_9ACTN